jgi:hypothetical protein
LPSTSKAGTASWMHFSGRYVHQFILITVGAPIERVTFRIIADPVVNKSKN